MVTPNRVNVATVAYQKPSESGVYKGTFRLNMSKIKPPLRVSMGLFLPYETDGTNITYFQDGITIPNAYGSRGADVCTREPAFYDAVLRRLEGMWPEFFGSLERAGEERAFGYLRQYTEALRKGYPGGEFLHGKTQLVIPAEDWAPTSWLLARSRGELRGEQLPSWKHKIVSRR